MRDVLTSLGTTTWTACGMGILILGTFCEADACATALMILRAEQQLACVVNVDSRRN